MPKATVSAAIALVHASGGAARRAKEVTAVIGDRNEPPKISGDREAMGLPLERSGSAAPSVTAAMTAAAPRPPFKRARIGLQTNTPAIAAQPSSAQKNAISRGEKCELLR